MAITKEAYAEQLAFLLRLNRDSVTTRMHLGYGGTVEATFTRLLATAPPHPTRPQADRELWARVAKAKEAWFVRGVTLPFVTTTMKEQATTYIDTFLTMAQQCLAEQF